MPVELIDLTDRWGYIVDVKGTRIKQEYAPAIGGNVKMTKDQAEKLANLVEQKTIQINSASVHYDQIYDLWDGKRTMQQIIDDEKDLIVKHTAEAKEKGII